MNTFRTYAIQVSIFSLVVIAFTMQAFSYVITVNSNAGTSNVSGDGCTLAEATFLASFYVDNNITSYHDCALTGSASDITTITFDTGVFPPQQQTFIELGDLSALELLHVRRSMEIIYPGANMYPKGQKPVVVRHKDPLFRHFGIRVFTDDSSSQTAARFFKLRSIAIDGGGIALNHMQDDADVILENVDIYNARQWDTDQPGGALATAKSKSVVIHQSNIYDNSAVLGGGIAVETQHLHIVRSTFTYNDAQSGGAVYVTNAKDIQSQDIVFQSFNSTYSHNGAYEKGGAIFANNANIDFYHNTILENYFRSWNLAHIWSQTGGGNYEDPAWQLQEQPTLKGRAIYISDINPGYVDIQHPMYISLFGNVIFGLSGVSADLLYYDVMQSIYWVQWFPAHYNNLMSNSIGGPALLTSAVGNVNVANGTNLNLVEDATLGLTAVHRVHPGLLGQPGYTSIIDQLHPCISRNEVNVFFIGPVDQVQLTDSDTRVHTFALIDQSHETDQLGNPRPTGTGGACDFGAVEETSITGLESLQLGTLEVYPTRIGPNQPIWFKLDHVASVQGQWINAAGQMISITLPSTPLDRAQITVPNVPGVWILRLETNTKTYTKRVIVQP